MAAMGVDIATKGGITTTVAVTQTNHGRDGHVTTILIRAFGIVTNVAVDTVSRCTEMSLNLGFTLSSLSNNLLVLIN